MQESQLDAAEGEKPTNLLRVSSSGEGREGGAKICACVGSGGGGGFERGKIDVPPFTHTVVVLQAMFPRTYSEEQAMRCHKK